jgi:hypothetical protein
MVCGLGGSLPCLRLRGPEPAWNRDALLRGRRRLVPIEVEALLRGSRLPLLDRHRAHRAAAAGRRPTAARMPAAACRRAAAARMAAAASATAAARMRLCETRSGRREK